MTTPTAATGFLVILADRAGTQHPVNVDAAAVLEDGSMICLSRIIAAEARKNLASRTIEYESYNSDSQYMDDLDRKAESYTLVSIGKNGVKKTFEVDGLYSDQSGPWTDDVQAVDEDEAHFQGAWQMSLNAGEDPAHEGDFLDGLDDHTIHHAALRPIRTEDLATAVLGLIDAHRSGHGIEAEIAGLADMVARLGYRPAFESAALASAA
jgi:hypothetical protein